MNKNNFFMVMLLGLAALVGTNFEVRCSEQPSSLTPYIVVGTVVGGAVLVTALTNTKTYKTYSKDSERRAQEKEISENPLLHAKPLSGETSISETPKMNDRAQAFLQKHEKQRHDEAQKFATKKTEKTLPSHIIDDYSGQ